MRWCDQRVTLRVSEHVNLEVSWQSPADRRALGRKLGRAVIACFALDRPLRSFSMDEISSTPASWNDLIELLPVGLTVSHYPTDDPADGYLVAANPAASRMLGFDLSGFIGVVPSDEGIDDRFDAGEVSAGAQLSFDVAIGGAPIALENFVVEHGPGRGHYQSTIFPLPGRRAASVFRRTDREAAASQALDWAMNSLESANRALSTFASTVAHDLKNPLGGIAGNAELVKMMSPELAHEASVALDRVIELSATSASMVDGLLRYAKAPTLLATEPVDLRSIFDWVVNLLAEQIESTAATISVVGDAVAMANEAALRQVMLNLVSNSLRYRDDARTPVIVVQLGVVGGRVSLRIVDNGVGIESDMRERVFEWGVRHDAGGAAPGGSGLGLAASRAALGSLGGTLDIEEPDGPGTVVGVTLPAAP